MPTALEVYAETVRPLPPSEQLRLAALILEELSQSAAALDVGEPWSEQDLRDLTAFSLGHAQQSYPEEDELV